MNTKANTETSAPWGKSWGYYLTPAGSIVNMQRKGQRVRFFDCATGDQVGPEQRNVAPAVAAALSVGWRML